MHTTPLFAHRLRFVLFVSVVLLVIGDGLGCRNKPAIDDRKQNTVGFPPPPTKTGTSPDALTKRLGGDDGFALAVLFGGDIQGDLNDCGCPHHPQGGLVWRMGYAEQLQRLAPGAAVLNLDAGGLFNHRTDASFSEEAQRRNEWVLRAYDAAGFVAANISRDELPMLSRLLRGSPPAAGSLRFPFLRRMVSANVRSTQPDLASPPPYVIETVTALRLARPLRIGIVGVVAPVRENEMTEGFIIETPGAVLPRVITELRPKVDLLIVLFYGRESQIADVTRNPGIDLVIAAGKFSAPSSELKTLNGTVIVQAAAQTKRLGEVRWRMTETGRLELSQFRTPLLDAVVPKPERWERFVSQFRREIDDIRRRTTGM